MAKDEEKKPLLGNALAAMARGDYKEDMSRFGVDYTEWQCLVQNAVLAMKGHVPEEDRKEVASALIIGAINANEDKNLKKVCIAALENLEQKDVLQTVYDSLDPEDEFGYNDYDDAVELIKSIATGLKVTLILRL